MPQLPSYTLYCPAGSFRAFASLIAAEYNGIDIKVVTDPKIVEDAIKTKSPTGKAPILEIINGGGSGGGSGDASIIFSSHSIARYVAGLRADTGLLGGFSNHQDRIAIDSWMDWVAQDVELPCCILFYPIAGYMATNREATSNAMKDLRNALEKVESVLKDKNKTYLLGDGNAISLADIVLASTLLYPFKLVCDKSGFLMSYPNIVRWYENCVSQKEFVNVVGKVEICETSLLPLTGEDDDDKPNQQQQQQQNDDDGEQQERRMVAIAITPNNGIDPQGLYKKIISTIVSQPEYKLKWDDNCKVESGKIYASFTIALEADYDEEVMEMIEMMEDEVANQEVTFQSAME